MVVAVAALLLEGPVADVDAHLKQRKLSYNDLPCATITYNVLQCCNELRCATMSYRRHGDAAARLHVDVLVAHALRPVLRGGGLEHNPYHILV